MGNTYIWWAIIICMLFISIMIAAVLSYLYRQDVVGKVRGKYKDVKARHVENVQLNVDKRISYNVLDEKMLKKGIKYRVGDNFTPFDYTIMRLIVSALFGFLALLVEPYLMVIGVLCGYFIVPFYFNYENKNDNNEMLSDIAMVFGIASLQLNNGVFLTDVIYECYRDVEHPRLKKALLELSMEIDKFGSVKEAAVSFRSKFENKFLDTFAKTLEQAAVTGTAAELFKDIESQVEGINDAIVLREEQKINNVCFIFQTLVFVGTILFIAYTLTSMLGESSGILF